MESVKFSIILCTHNAPPSFAALLQSLANQDFPARQYEVLAVDNSAHGAAQIIVDSVSQSHPGRIIRYIRETTPGKSHALNTGVRESRGEIIAFLDDDISLNADWLTALDQAFESPEIAGAGGKILPKWEGPPPPWFTPAVAGFTPAHDFGDKPLAYQPPWSCPIGANMAFRKYVLEQAGPFDTKLGHCGANKLGGEESDLCRRIHYLGYKMTYWPRARVTHPFTWAEKSKAHWRRRVFTQGRMAAYILFKDTLPLLGTRIKHPAESAMHRKQPGKNLFYYQLKTALMAGFACGLIFGPEKH
ncbi:MAG: glycosyltransferase family 2 protein [Desulfatibacillum sp.]|nr:glycosyltransferase family 2 protein [Desulfatibacillum sp.]